MLKERQQQEELKQQQQYNDNLALTKRSSISQVTRPIKAIKVQNNMITNRNIQVVAGTMPGSLGSTVRPILAAGMTQIKPTDLVNSQQQLIQHYQEKFKYQQQPINITMNINMSSNKSPVQSQSMNQRPNQLQMMVGQMPQNTLEIKVVQGQAVQRR